MVGSIIFYACVDEEITGKDSEKEVIAMDPPAEHSEIDTTEFDTIPANGQAIQDGCVSLWNNMLYFTDAECFNQFYESIYNKGDGILDAWADNLGFLSIYEYYSDLEDGGSHDHIELLQERLPSTYYERILNQNYQVRIAEGIYTLNREQNTLNYLDSFGTHQTDTTFLLEGSNKTYNCFESHYQEWQYKYFDSDNRIGIRKYVINHTYFIEIGCQVVRQEKGPFDWWYNKRHSKSVLLDQWHEIRYELWDMTNNAIVGTPRVKTNQPIEIKKSKLFTIRWDQELEELEFYEDNVWKWRSQAFKLCEDDYERLHAWTFDFNNDLHNDTWPN